MTAVPKHWPSSRRQGKRRATHKQTLPKLASCKTCGQPKMPGFICLSCDQKTGAPKIEPKKGEK